MARSSYAIAKVFLNRDDLLVLIGATCPADPAHVDAFMTASANAQLPYNLGSVFAAFLSAQPRALSYIKEATKTLPGCYAHTIHGLCENILDMGCRETDIVSPVFDTVDETRQELMQHATPFVTALDNKIKAARQYI